MNMMTRMLPHPPLQPVDRAAQLSSSPAVVRRGWPPLTVTSGTHRRSTDATEWHPDGPVDPWKRSQGTPPS